MNKNLYIATFKVWVWRTGLTSSKEMCKVDLALEPWLASNLGERELWIKNLAKYI